MHLPSLSGRSYINYSSTWVKSMSVISQTRSLKVKNIVQDKNIAELFNMGNTLKQEVLSLLAPFSKKPTCISGNINIQWTMTWTSALIPELSEEDCKSYAVSQYAPFCQIEKCSHYHSLIAQTLSTLGEKCAFQSKIQTTLSSSFHFASFQ